MANEEEKKHFKAGFLCGVLAACLLYLAIWCVPTHAAGYEDQSQESAATFFFLGTANNLSHTRTLCQSFVPSKDTVAAFDLAFADLYHSGSQYNNVALYFTSGGCPHAGGATLDTHTLTLTELQAHENITPSVLHWTLGSPVNVTPGTTYYVSLEDTDACDNCYGSSGTASDLYASGTLQTGDWSGTYTNHPTEDLFFREYPVVGPEASTRIPVTISATGTTITGAIGFSGNVALTFRGETVNDVRVDVARVDGGAGLTVKEFRFDPPSPVGRFDSAELYAAANAVYPAGTYVVSVTASSPSWSGSAYASFVELGPVGPTGQAPVVPPNLSNPDLQLGFDFTGSGSTTGAELSKIDLQQGLDCDTKPDASATDSAASAAAARFGVQCFIKKWQGLPLVTWIYGIPAAIWDAEHDAVPKPYVLGIPWFGGPGQGFLTSDGSAQIALLDSSSNTPPIVQGIVDNFPHYYSFFELLLWLGFAISIKVRVENWQARQVFTPRAGSGFFSYVANLAAFGVFGGLFLLLALKAPPFPIFVYDALVNLFGYVISMNAWIPSYLALNLLFAGAIVDAVLFSWTSLVKFWGLIAP